MDVLKLILALLVLVGVLFVGFKTVIYTHHRLGISIRSGRIRWLARLALIVVSCAVGAVLASLRWKWSDTQMIIGTPVPVAAWELRNGHWQDFVGPISIFLWIFDFIIWIGLVHFPIAFGLYLKSRKGQLQ